MSSVKLTYMGNQIARNFAALPHDEAVANTRDHIVKFWNPLMRNRILDHLSQTEEGFEPLLVEALRGLKQS